MVASISLAGEMFGLPAVRPTRYYSRAHSPLIYRPAAPNPIPAQTQPHIPPSPVQILFPRNRSHTSPFARPNPIPAQTQPHTPTHDQILFPRKHNHTYTDLTVPPPLLWGPAPPVSPLSPINHYPLPPTTYLPHLHGSTLPLVPRRTPLIFSLKFFYTVSLMSTSCRRLWNTIGPRGFPRLCYRALLVAANPASQRHHTAGSHYISTLSCSS